jgi:hypothetical protein
MSHKAYRYLNVHQLRMLYFPSPRSAQIRLKQLKDLGLLQRWRSMERLGITRRPFIFRLSSRPEGSESDPCPQPWN